MRGLVLIPLAVMVGCPKVPITDVAAFFARADTAWFEAEQTLFLFYDVSAQQGLGDPSIIEVTYRTDDELVPWTRLEDLTPVHTHLKVDCGANRLCGSMSVYVPIVPRDVRLRLRYHYDGAMALDPSTTFNVIAAGPAYSNRSFVVYGVFDEANRRVQWRGRHQFPTLRNEEAEALGLRRYFAIRDQRYGDFPEAVNLVNPYGYGFAEACPDALLPTGAAEPLETEARAIFNQADFPLATSTAPLICASATVTDATGTFTTAAIARKNPEVRPAFPALHSPIHTVTQLKFLLAPCERTISNAHKNMQKQRLLISGGTDVCLDDWESQEFADDLAATLRDRIDLVREAGNDMVLTLALHHDNSTGALARRVEKALAQVLTPERDKSSPRAVGAFVFDSYTHPIADPALRPLVLWCPSNKPPGSSEPDTSQRTCAILPDNPELILGPFSFTSLPILPTRDGYLDFIDDYSEGQAGKVDELSFRAPELTPISENVQVGPFAVATFFNNEIITAAATDAFSYCAAAAQAPIVFRSEGSPDPNGIEVLVDVHATAPEANYQLGLLWDFPFLMRMTYEVVLAGSATAFAVTVPFGLSGSTDSYYGTSLWEQESFPLGEALLQCTRFCDHPTFDSAGVYNVYDVFRATYAHICYRPRYPAPGDGGFPVDP